MRCKLVCVLCRPLGHKVDKVSTPAVAEETALKPFDQLADREELLLLMLVTFGRCQLRDNKVVFDDLRLDKLNLRQVVCLLFFNGAWLCSMHRNCRCEHIRAIGASRGHHLQEGCTLDGLLDTNK